MSNLPRAPHTHAAVSSQPGRSAVEVQLWTCAQWPRTQKEALDVTELLERGAEDGDTSTGRVGLRTREQGLAQSLMDVGGGSGTEGGELEEKEESESEHTRSITSAILQVLCPHATGDAI